MKIKIEATDQGLKIASCFNDVELEGGHVFNCVIGRNFIFNGALGPESIGDEVTIDLLKSQPCIYQCMKHGFKVEVELKDNTKKIYHLSLTVHKVILLRVLPKIKSIKILNLDEMEGIEVIE